MESRWRRARYETGMWHDGFDLVGYYLPLPDKVAYLSPKTTDRTGWYVENLGGDQPWSAMHAWQYGGVPPNFPYGVPVVPDKP